MNVKQEISTKAENPWICRFLGSEQGLLHFTVIVFVIKTRFIQMKTAFPGTEYWQQGFQSKRREEAGKPPVEADRVTGVVKEDMAAER